MMIVKWSSSSNKTNHAYNDNATVCIPQLETLNSLDDHEKVNYYDIMV